MTVLPPIIDLDRMKQRGERLGEYRGKNPTIGLITAAEQLALPELGPSCRVGEVYADTPLG